ncbi:MAG: hypothetical protein ACLTKZ_04235, partial [Lachnospiraceae bacterium]
VSLTIIPHLYTPCQLFFRTFLKFFNFFSFFFFFSFFSPVYAVLPLFLTNIALSSPQEAVSQPFQAEFHVFYRILQASALSPPENSAILLFGSSPDEKAPQNNHKTSTAEIPFFSRP